MNKISRLWVRAAMICMAGFLILAVTGAILKMYMISFIGVFLAFVMIWIKMTKLVCPHCGEQKKVKPINFMSWSKPSEYHCPRCGELIEIDDSNAF